MRKTNCRQSKRSCRHVWEAGPLPPTISKRCIYPGKRRSSWCDEGACWDLPWQGRRHPAGGVTGTIYSLGIQQAFRRQGLGSALLAAAEGWLAGIGARTIWIPVPDGRPGVLTFFANWGYTIGEVAVALYGHGRDGLLLVRSVASDRTPAGLRSCWTRGGPWGEMDPNV